MRTSGNAALRLEETYYFPGAETAADGYAASSYVDGYVVAAAISPEPIPSGEAIENLLRDDINEVGWGDLSLAAAGYAERSDAVRKSFARKAFAPLIYEDQVTGDTTVADWVDGFLFGMTLRPAPWRALVDSQDDHMAAIAVFLRDEDGNYLVGPDDDPTLAELRADAAGYLSEALAGIYRVFRKSGGHFRGARRIGRNDPCPCGSGRKSKRCCADRA